MWSPVELPFKFDGKKLENEGIKLYVDRCEVEGVNFPVPKQHALLLLNEEIKAEAWKFLKEVSKAPLIEDAKTGLLEKCYAEGSEPAREMLQRFLQHAPRGRPRLYAKADATFEWRTDTHRIVMTDGEAGFEFYTYYDLNAEQLGLPINVYCEPTYTTFSLGMDHYRKIIGHEEEFFNFIKNLHKARGHILKSTLEKCYSLYFQDKAEAFTMLKEITARAAYRERRDALFSKLKRDGFLQVQGGLFIWSGWHTYYVSEDGGVFRFKSSDGADTREAVLKAYEKVKKPTKLIEVEDGEELKSIARMVGRAKPELVVVILPSEN